ncbi:class I SAM-dependent methyltransferase [Candidatus Woesebacteria bacterium]|nr:MAG: class I SAM-dependent methyltransferase [Candidatus Woesebacteria bacterium]
MAKQVVRNWGIEKIELSPWYFNSLRLKYALEAIKGTKGKLLEVGAGAGAFSKSIKKHCPDLEVTASDIETSLLDLGKGICNEINFVKADVCNLPFKNNAFQAIVSFDVFEHIDNPHKAINEVYRVLDRKGVFHCATPIEGNILTIHGIASKLKLNPKEKYAGHVQRYDTTSLIKHFSDAGFENIKVNYSGHYFYQLMDFSYFLTLTIFKKFPNNTFEGYIENLPSGTGKSGMSLLRSLLATVCFVESLILKNFPGQIAHYTASKK